MLSLLPFVIAGAALTGVRGSPVVPTAPLSTQHNSTCVQQAKSQCLDGVKHRDGLLTQAGCTIVAESQCGSHPKLPEYCPDANLVRHALAWNPPAGCQASWNKCISEINVPYFNRPVCGQYLTVLCKDTLVTEEERDQIDDALEVLYMDFSKTLTFFYDHVPASKAVAFDECIDTAHHTFDTSNGTMMEQDPGADIFFACLDDIKHNSTTNNNDHHDQHPHLNKTLTVPVLVPTYPNITAPAVVTAIATATAGSNATRLETRDKKHDLDALRD